jgi:hypothetical protein
MEILIPGLILVALMVYVSTKIKKSAAEAYEEEFIDRDEFSITKPEGFINPLNADSPFTFEVYTKEFANEPNERLRKATAELRVFEDAKFDEVADIVRNSAPNVVSDIARKDGRRTQIIQTEEFTDNANVSAYHKIVEGDGKVFHLRAWALAENKDEYSRKMEEMLDSFAVK